MPPKNKEPKRLSSAAITRMAEAMLDARDAEEPTPFGAHFERHRAPPPIDSSPEIQTDDEHAGGAPPSLSDVYGQSPTNQRASFVEGSSRRGTGARSSSSAYHINALTAPSQRFSITKAATVKNSVGTRARGKTGTAGGAGSEAKNAQTIKHYFEDPPMEFSSRTETLEMNQLKQNRIEAEKAKEAAARVASGVDMEGEAHDGGEGKKRKKGRIMDRDYANRTKRSYRFKDGRPLKGPQPRGKGKRGKADMGGKGGEVDDGDDDDNDSDDDDDDTVR